MSADDILLEAEDHMEKSIAHLKQALTGIRTGRATPGLIDSLRVEVYGSQTPIKQLASIGADGSSLVVRPYDPGTIKDIEKAINASNLGLNPQSDGRLIRLIVPALSTEVRKKMVSRIKELVEECKVSIRNTRRDANKHADDAEEEGGLTEDQCKKAKEDIQDLTKKYEGTAESLAKAREAEVMEN